MEEEVNYVTVTFKTDDISTLEKPNNMEIIYDEVKTQGKEWDAHSVIKVTSELRRQNFTLTEENLQLWSEKAALERIKEDLIRERNQLNWTVEVILDYEEFPVKKHCPQKVCKPCLDDWLLFQSNCYLFAKSRYSNKWETWERSRNDCRAKHADLVVINSQKEQEFINNHIEEYNDEKHGYWIGLKKDTRDQWIWVDGSNFTQTYWSTQEPGYRTSCALSNPRKDPLANWDKPSCTMKNCWICERKALIRPE